MRKAFALTLAILTAALSGVAYAESPPPTPKTPPVPVGTELPVPLTLTTSTGLTPGGNPYGCYVRSQYPHESTSGTDPGYVHGKGDAWCNVPGIVYLEVTARLYEKFGWGWWQLNSAMATGASSALITATARTQCDGNVLYRVESTAWARDPAGNWYTGTHIGLERWVDCQPQ